MRGSLRVFLREFGLFGLKQARASAFGGFLLGAILATSVWTPPGLHRYDLLLAAAVAFQAALLLLHWETLREATVILVFHAVATAMELFKTSEAIGSWSYPGMDEGGGPIFRLGGVPLFAGFMYSAVGSYLARVGRLFDFRFRRYPNRTATIVLVALVYANFFTHHYAWDARWALVAATLLLFGPTTVYFRIDRVHRRMPLAVGFGLVALFLWIAENVGTFGRVWVYPSQADGWRPVGIDKFTAWYLLMILSFVLVTLVQPPRTYDVQNIVE